MGSFITAHLFCYAVWQEPRLISPAVSRSALFKCGESEQGILFTSFLVLFFDSSSLPYAVELTQQAGS